MTIAHALSLGGWLFSSLCGLAQGSFQNMDFEEGPIYHDQDFSALYPDVLPGWTVLFDDIAQPGASCNLFTLDDTVVALMSDDGILGPDYVIEGNRSVYLQTAPSDITGDPVDGGTRVSISQTGIIPHDAQWLMFEARNQWYDYFPVPPGPFSVIVGGVDIPMVPIESDGANMTLAGSIAEWAGQAKELSIGVVVPPSPPVAGLWEGWAVVDSIRFAVPEPTSVTLVGLGLLWLGWGRWRRLKHPESPL